MEISVASEIWQVYLARSEAAPLAHEDEAIVCAEFLAPIRTEIVEFQMPSEIRLGSGPRSPVRDPQSEIR